MIFTAEDVIVFQTFLVDKTRNFQAGAEDRHQGREQGNFHAAVIQIASPRQHPAAVADEEDRVGADLLPKTAQQLREASDVFFASRLNSGGKIVRTSPRLRSTASRKSASGIGLSNMATAPAFKHFGRALCARSCR